MKYGIDSEKGLYEEGNIYGDYIKEYIIKSLREMGHTVIDCGIKEGKNPGENLFNKVIISNSNSIDLFISIKVIPHGENRAVIYIKNSDVGNIQEKFAENLKELDIFSIDVKEGDFFYLLKNIKATAMILELYLDEGNYNKINDISNKILHSLCQ